VVLFRSFLLEVFVSSRAARVRYFLPAAFRACGIYRRETLWTDISTVTPAIHPTSQPRYRGPGPSIPGPHARQADTGKTYPRPLRLRTSPPLHSSPNRPTSHATNFLHRPAHDPKYGLSPTPLLPNADFSTAWPNPPSTRFCMLGCSGLARAGHSRHGIASLKDGSSRSQPPPSPPLDL
jgi:hypothetical protein